MSARLLNILDLLGHKSEMASYHANAAFTVPERISISDLL